jgi:hypothetical protein
MNLKAMPMVDSMTFKLEAQGEVPTMIAALDKGTIRKLDLSGQEYVDDSFILDKILQGGRAERLIDIDLSETSVSKLTLEKLASMQRVGTIRDLPQESARFQSPAAEISVQLKRNQLPKEELDQYSQKAFGYFTLQYRNPKTNQENFSPRKGVKILNIVQK